ncbi:hypothetical protein NJ76_20335 [Rhodococcus sp. IITR03]|nr:hypothetical protein NJ76_20335 [Rhodococcus sp. IITR03]
MGLPHRARGIGPERLGTVHQVVAAEDGQAPQVVEGADLTRVHLLAAEPLPVERRGDGRPSRHRTEPTFLEGADLVGARRGDPAEFTAHRGGEWMHTPHAVLDGDEFLRRCHGPTFGSDALALNIPVV